jgi:hypothetical protein
MFRYWWEKEVNWKKVLKVAGAVTTATPNITRVAYSQRRKKDGDDEEE